jgi:hypothetical protein
MVAAFVDNSPRWTPRASAAAQPTHNRWPMRD